MEQKVWACARCQTTNTADGNCTHCEAPRDWTQPVPPQTLQQPQESKPTYDLIGGLLRIRDVALLSETPAALRQQVYNDAVVLEGWIREHFAKDKADTERAAA